MHNQSVYLKPNVILEPLVNQWYAWTYLIAPTTAAMYIANSHLKIMQSFISAPKVHIAAHKNPKLLGGPFINYDESRVNEIETLLQETAQRQAHMVQLAEAIKALDDLLKNEADGHSLKELYQKIPEALQGYVELTYDLKNQPSVRFIEGLLYQSDYYDLTAQSISLSLIHHDERPFIFSTPKLEEQQSLNLPIPFNYLALDQLFKMRSEPGSFEFIHAALNVKDTERFKSFFTENEPPKRLDYEEESVRIRYFGHACLLIETKGISILCDPLISYRHESGIPRYSYADLPDSIDYALITHQHHDHCVFETLLQLRHKIKTIVLPKSSNGVLSDPSIKLALKNTGFNQIVEIDEMEAIWTEAGTITGLPFFGEHADLNIHSKLTYAISLKSKTILVMADANNFETKTYEHIHRSIGNVDVVFIGLQCAEAPLTWAYGPLLTQPLSRSIDRSRHLNGANYQQALDVVNQFNPKLVYVYALGYEPWLSYMQPSQYNEEALPIVESKRLIEACRRREILAERLFAQKEIVLE
ncbi:MBL fold metallo-hydrolase [Oscillatoria sp. CS-180]|uniref:MBL fold metallo-hydrolase n=1 Tax=Oscillatoria sp. CS-180 TaxID=3021720 RepID=UPI00232E6BCC|nr:MBL fold metallo-hydrolase [Oscillatoria sp. CS-180]MDB9527418.1 MBL fold metallo-hydrolase [Oscillatoria sp. CS-180]